MFVLFDTGDHITMLPRGISVAHYNPAAATTSDSNSTVTVSQDYEYKVIRAIRVIRDPDHGSTAQASERRDPPTDNGSSHKALGPQK